MKRRIGLYIHIPFCRRMCFYCHFTKIPYSEKDEKKYVNFLIKEIRMRTKLSYVVDTIYIGGGSPSLVLPESLFRIGNEIQRNYKVDDPMELSIECNPEDIDKKKIIDFIELGCNRLSIGAQSFDPKDLEFLGRHHDVNSTLNAIDLALNAGLTNLNIDLMIGLPTQTNSSIKKSLLRLKSFKIPHLSVYILEEVNKKYINEKKSIQQYYYIRQLLLDSGYEHYEVSNFAFPGSQCQHNLKYWKDQSYIGLGLGSSGFERGLDYKNTSKLDLYINLVKQNKLPVAEIHRLDPEKRKIITGFRLLQGMPRSCFKRFPTEIQQLCQNGFVYKNKHRLAIKPEKILLLNEILAYFI